MSIHDMIKRGMIGQKKAINLNFAGMPDGSYYGTWSVASGVLKNAPNLGGTLVTNPTFEGTYTEGLAPSWIKSGTPTVTEETGVTGSAQGIENGSASNIVQQELSHAAKVWYRLTVSGKRVSGTNGVYARLLSTIIGTSTDVLSFTTTSFVSKSYVFKSIAAAFSNLRLYAGSSTKGAFDNLNVYPLTKSELFKSWNVGKAPRLSCRAGITLDTSLSKTAIFVLGDAGNDNYLMGYIEGSTAYLVKCIAGVDTVLKSGSIVYGAGKYLEITWDGATAKILYDGTQVSTDATVTDAELRSNTYCGVFSGNDSGFNSFQFRRNSNPF